MGAMVAKMAVPGPVDVSRELRALTDVVAAYVDQHREHWQLATSRRFCYQPVDRYSGSSEERNLCAHMPAGLRWWSPARPGSRALACHGREHGSAVCEPVEIGRASTIAAARSSPSAPGLT